MRTTLPRPPSSNRYALLPEKHEGPTAAQRKRVQERAGAIVNQWRDAFSKVVAQAQTSGRPRPVRPLDLHEMPNTLAFLAAVATGQLKGADPQTVESSLQPELAKQTCPAAASWLKRAVADFKAGKQPSGATVKAIRQGLVSYADNYAARLAVNLFERAQRDNRPFTAGEREEIGAAFAHTLELRGAVNLGGGEDALKRAGQKLTDLDVIGSLFQPSPHQPKPIHATNNAWIEKFKPVTDWLKAYHQYEVHGLENIPKAGPAIIAMNHSVQTYEMGLLHREIHNQRSRDMRMLGDHMLFVTPGINWVATQFGAIDGHPDRALNALENGELLGVCPGGQREQLSTEKGKLLWDRALGYARLAIQSGAPVVLAATPAADQVYDQVGWFNKWITQPVYKHLKVPVTMTTGAGIPQPGWIKRWVTEPLGRLIPDAIKPDGLPWISCPPLPPNPKKIKLDTFVSKPFYPPVVRKGLAKGDPRLEKLTRELARKLYEQMNGMMGNEPLPT